MEISNCWAHDIGKGEVVVAFDLVCEKMMLEELEEYDFIVLHDIRSVKREGYTATRLKTSQKCLQKIYEDKQQKSEWKEFCEWIKEVTS